MIPEVGHFSLIIALMLAGAQCAFLLAGAALGRSDWTGLARPLAAGVLFFVLLAFGSLMWSFVFNDFSVLYVTQHSNTALPLRYRMAAVWGGHEGSILLWLLILSFWTFAVTIFSRNLDAETLARIVGVIGIITIGFLLFILFTSNPFDRILPAPANGQDLNPQLQDPGLIMHPPMLYMGYVGTVVPFGFAMAALISGRLDAAWARWSRPWATVSWCFLTAGIALGSAWAYYVLGWGGWWFWDPVENASLVPWLVSTALIHSLAVTEKRNTFKMWTVLLAIIAFSLSLLGTFLVRSGVLTSVHAFATDPTRGVFILAFFGLVTGASLALFAWRGAKVAASGGFSLVSRESMLLGNNVVLTVAAGAVLLGTLYPLLIDGLGLGKLSVGPPYFNAVFIPLMAPALFLMGIGPIARWRKAEIGDLATRLRWAIIVSLVAALLTPFLFGQWRALTSFGYLLAFWIFTTTLLNLAGRRRQRARQHWTRLRSQPASFYGMLVAHFAMGVVVFGITSVVSFEQEQDVVMHRGDVVSLAGYDFRLNDVVPHRGPNYTADRATVTVLKNDRIVTVLQPEKRVFLSADSMAPTTIAAIDSGLTRDLYVALGDPLENGGWVVRAYHKPFVAWIWGGGLLMAFGGGLALLDKRYRIRRRARSSAKEPTEPSATGLVLEKRTAS